MHKIIELDQSLFLYLNGLGNTYFDTFWIMVSGKLTWLPLYFIFLYLIIKNYEKKKVIYILLFITLGIIISDQIANIFKIGVHRFRPCHEPILEGLVREVKCGGPFGFYSAHASNSFFIASFMNLIFSKRIKFFGLMVFAWASFVAYSRIYLGVHYPLDIIYGAMVGFLLGGFFGSLALYASKPKRL
ncbi:phosphatase PAP2 family protein [Riemerella anatipestifer]|nr:phosphatase PAP2 family protein [Riemerella anatipestifer]